MTKEKLFSTGEYVVYPTHGVGQVTGIEKQDISGSKMEVIIVNFEKEKMTLRVPVAKSVTSGMRGLSSRKVMETALTTLLGSSGSSGPWPYPTGTAWMNIQ